jgi:hypothetical protein
VENWLRVRENWTLAELLDVVLNDDCPSGPGALMWAVEFLRHEGRAMVAHQPGPAPNQHTPDDVIVSAGGELDA